MTGSLLVDNPERYQTLSENVFEELEGHPKEAKELGADIKKFRENEEAFLDFVNRVYRAYSKNRSQPRTPIRKAVRIIWEEPNEPNDDPCGPADRSFIREVPARAIEIMAEHEVNTTVVDFQALLWFPEKQVYVKLKQTTTKGLTDYETEAVRYVAKKEIDERKVSRAIRRAKLEASRGLRGRRPEHSGAHGESPGGDGPGTQKTGRISEYVEPITENKERWIRRDIIRSARLEFD